MALSRDLTLRIHAIFDQWLPPVLRDQRWFMGPFLRVLYKHRTRDYLDFKDKAFAMDEGEFRDTYRRVNDVMFDRETDLNRACVARILKEVRGPKVLEVGCGQGYLTKLLAKEYEVSAADIVIGDELRAALPDVAFQECNIEALPFADRAFDTVVCTHTLEHVRNLGAALDELRRVARRVIIVVPRQRPYQYTFDMHLSYFPYEWSLLFAFAPTGAYVCEDIGGDWFYMEDRLGTGAEPGS